MNGIQLKGPMSVGRRDFIAGMVSVSTSSIAGCGDSRNADRHEELEPGEDSLSSNSRGALPEELQKAKREIETVFAQLSNLPIFENDEFVFDVSYFENEFDHREVKRTSERAIERIDKNTNDNVSDSKIEGLMTSAVIGRLLVAQRVMTHQIIAAGLTFERYMGHGNYEQGLEVIQNASQFLENLRTTGEKIDIQLSDHQNLNLSIDGYDASSIKKSQKNLLVVVRWSDQVFEALYHAALGLKKYNEGNNALESEQYNIAESLYSESERQFRTAARSFNKAQGTGRQIPHLVPLVEGVRCMIPAYIASSGPMQTSMGEFNAGNEKRAREIAGEAISSANEKAARCL